MVPGPGAYEPVHTMTKDRPSSAKYLFNEKDRNF